MFSFDGWSVHTNDWVESFIGENLSIYQARWLKSQCDALGQTGGKILEAVLKEWLLNHPQEVWEKLPNGEIARRAMNEFIVRHHKEFEPVLSSR